ncbi:hypothetical protein OH77DRAFT_1415677, partial [Trametes cingulata]
TSVSSTRRGSACPRARPDDVSTSRRQVRKSAKEREAELTKDRWARQVDAHRVQCAGCNRWIVLHKKRVFDLTNWEGHRRHCSHITGVERVRIANVTKEGKVVYTIKTVSATPSVKQFFSASASGHSQAVQKRPNAASTSSAADRRTVHPVPAAPVQLRSVPCEHLRGDEFLEYILRTQTRSLGGISSRRRGLVVRQLFPYKRLPPLQDRALSGPGVGTAIALAGAPEGGNLELSESKWTLKEQLALDHALKARARWIVDYGRQYIKSTRCDGMTENETGVCDACDQLRRTDEGFRRSLRRDLVRKRNEAKKTAEEQREIGQLRAKFTPKTMRATEARDLELKMSDPNIFTLAHELERGNSAAAFLALYRRAKEGKLVKYQTFVDICNVLKTQLELSEGDNGAGARKGIRYPADYLNFMTMMRSYGQNSAQQYGILAAQIGGPCPRTLKNVIRRSPDVLTQPDLNFENMARVKRLIDSLNYHGPVAVAGDCTKVRRRLSYSNDHGSHILGSTLPLEECIVEETDDISRLVAKVNEQKEYASQVRAILIKVPLPHIPPLVVALRPTKGNDDAPMIYALHCELLRMAAQLGIKVVSLAADGASSEQGSQSLMDHSQSTLEPLSYAYPRYGIILRAPVLPTGPLISCQDPQHARKTCRNQPQHGTHTASLGRGVVVNRTLIGLLETGVAGLVRRDVENVDKQDDGAARRLFHHTALIAMTTADPAPGVTQVQEDFYGLFGYLFVFGELFDAWLNRRLAAHDRVLAAFRARFFLHTWHNHIKQMERRFPDLYKPNRAFISPASFNIFNRLCDTLVLLALAYYRFYPDQPFCPWLVGTEFVEHFFGLARTLLPDFTYAEFLKLVKHVMLRQHILLSGKFSANKERSSRAGYILDYDASPLTPAELSEARVYMPEALLNQLVELAYLEATQIAKQLLRMPTPSLPLTLTPLRAPNTKAGKHSHHGSAGQSGKSSAVGGLGDDEETDGEVEEDEDEDEEADSEDSAAAAVSGASDASTPTAPVSESEEGAEVAALAQRTADAAHYTARYAALSDDLEHTIQELSETTAGVLLAEDRTQAGSLNNLPALLLGPQPPPPAISSSSSTTVGLPELPVISSKILDNDHRVIVQKMLDLRAEHQSGTTTRSERVIMLDPKFKLSRLQNPDLKMSVREASHHVRIAQELACTAPERIKTMREQRWQETARQVRKVISENELPNLSSRNVSALNPLRLGSLVIMRNEARTFLGEVLDIYKKANRRHGSVEMATGISGLSYLSLRVYLPLTVVLHLFTSMTAYGPEDQEDVNHEDANLLFSCRSNSVDIHTHAPAEHLLYHLGTKASSSSGQPDMLLLKPFAAARWHALTRRKVQQKLTIRIPGRMFTGSPSTSAPGQAVESESAAAPAPPTDPTSALATVL